MSFRKQSNAITLQKMPIYPFNLKEQLQPELDQLRNRVKELEIQLTKKNTSQNQ